MKIKITAVFIVTLVLLCGCTTQNVQDNSQSVNSISSSDIDSADTSETDIVSEDGVEKINGIEMTVQSTSLSATGAAVTITDNSEGFAEHTYGEWYRLDVKTENGWKPLEQKSEFLYNELGYLVNGDHEVTFKIDWPGVYGMLEAGVYRVVKRVYIGETPHNFAAEFHVTV